MAFDSPSLGGYTFRNPPDVCTITPEAINQVNELHDGQTRQRILGYRHRGSIVWEENWIRSTDLTSIMAVANDASATLAFIPRPTSFPTRSYAMVWTNKFQVQSWNGKHGVYNLAIELVSAATTATITDLP